MNINKVSNRDRKKKKKLKIKSIDRTRELDKLKSINRKRQIQNKLERLEQE